MQQRDQQLLILADFSSDFHLDELLDIAGNDQSIIFNVARYDDLELIEVIVEGIAHTISLHSAEEVRCAISGKEVEHVFCSPEIAMTAAIGLSLGNSVVSGKHLHAVNKSLLELASTIGKFVNARTVIWNPASVQTGFKYFEEMTAQYSMGCPLPILLQIAILESGNGQFQTRGLSYFSDQEIRFQAPQNCSTDQALRRLVELIQNVVAQNGMADNLSEQAISGEIVSYVTQTNQAALGAASRTF